MQKIVMMMVNAEVNQEIAAGAEVVESGSGKKIGTVSGS